MTPRGVNGVGAWAAGQNAGVSSAETLSVDTIVNSLTFSGTASLGSGLGASFGAFGPGGRILNVQLQGATAFLVKDGTTTYTAGALTSGTGTTMFGHVLQGATLNFNAGSAFGLGSTGGFVKGGDGVINFNAPIYLGAGNFAVNQGRVNLNSGFANTIPVLANTGGGSASNLRIEGLNAVVDLRNQPQIVNELRSSNEKPDQAGTLTNSLGSLVNFTTFGNSAFAGAITGNVNLVRSGNTTTTLTGASSYSGLTVVRGGNLLLRDAGALTGTSAVQVHNGALILDNYGLNPVENLTRLNPATPVTLSGGEFRVDGAGSSDIAVRVESLTAGSGRNTINVRPYVNMGGTVRVDVGNLVLTPGARQTVVINGWTTANSGGFNSLGNQSLTGSGLVFLEKVNGATGPANYNFSSVGTTNTSRIVTVPSTAGLTAGLAVSGTNIPAGATISSIVSATQIQISVAANNTNAAGTLRATNLTNNLIGGWAVANGSTFATYDSRYGVMEMGYGSGGFTGLGFTGEDFNTTVATGNYNDGATRTLTTGPKAANSWRMAPGAAQDITFASGANLTLGVGMITNANQLVRLLASDVTNTITAATGNDLYVFVNQNAINIEPKLTGTMALIGSGGAILRLKPKFASNDYTGGTFSLGGALNIDGTGSVRPVALTAGATTAASSTVTVASTTGLVAGMGVSGPGIPVGTTITTVTNLTTLVLSAPATVTATSLTFAASGLAGSTTAAGTTVTVPDTTGLTDGMLVTGANIPAGATIASVTDATRFVLSLPATATASGPVFVSGHVAIPGDLTLQNSTLNMQPNVAKAGQIAANANLTIKGAGRFLLPNYTDLLAGINVVNRLQSITFITDGAQGSNPDVGLGDPNDVAAFSVLALSGANAITSTNQVVGRVPTVYTSDSARTRLVFDNVAPVITVNAGEGLVGLNMNAPITQGANAGVSAGGFADMTSLTKMGAGTVAMINADSNFTANFILAGGSLMFGSNSVVDGLNNVLNGPVGTGSLVIEAGTALLSDGTVRTIHNPVTVNGNFIFAGQLGGAGVTLAGPVSLGATGRTINIPSLAVTTNLNGVLTSTAGAGLTGLTKTGNGTLKFGGTSSLSFGGAGLTVAGGLVQAGKAEQLPVDTLLTVNAGAGYDLLGFNQELNAIAGNGFITNSGGNATTFTLNNAADVAFGGVLADNKAVSPTSTSELTLRKLGIGTLTLTGASTYFGATNVDAGKIVVGNGGSLGTGAVAITTELEYARTDTFTLGNAFSGTGTLSFLGANGVAKLTGNSPTGPDSVVIGANSTLQIGDGGTTGALNGVTTLTMNAGSILRFSRSDVVVGAFSAPISGVASSRIEQNGTGKTSILGGVSVLGVGGFLGDVVVNAGELEAAGASGFEYARSITINAGTFTAAIDGALGYGMGGVAPDVTINGGLMRLLDSVGGTATNNGIGDLVLNGGTVSSGTTTGNNSLFVTGAITVNDNATISAVDVGLNSGGVAAASTDITVVANKTLTFSGTILDDVSNSVPSSFDKMGAGTLVLSGNNTGMTGNNTVSTGVLDVRNVNALGDGLTAGQMTTVSGTFVSNQTNFGTAGAVAGNITVSTGGSLGVAAPGVATIGNLNVSDLTLEGGSTIVFKIWDQAGGVGIGYDKLDLGTLDLAGASSANRITIKLISMSSATTFGNSTLALPTSPLNFGSFDFGTYDPLSGLGANVSDLFRFDATQFNYAGGTASDAGLWLVDFNAGAITLTAVPEPSTYGFGLGALALAAAALRRRRQTKKA
jgi:autotransporter-associated beta strand protein